MPLKVRLLYSYIRLHNLPLLAIPSDQQLPADHFIPSGVPRQPGSEARGEGKGEREDEDKER